MIKPVVIAVAETQSGNPKYRATLRMQDDTSGKYDGDAFTVQANDKPEFKEAIRPYVQAFVQQQNRLAQIKAVADEALSEVITEEMGA